MLLPSDGAATVREPPRVLVAPLVTPLVAPLVALLATALLEKPIIPLPELESPRLRLGLLLATTAQFADRCGLRKAIAPEDAEVEPDARTGGGEFTLTGPAHGGLCND